MKKKILAICTSLICVVGNAQESIDTKPQINGTIRAKYEYNSSRDQQRFQVRNARFGVTGNVNTLVSYKAEMDLSDEGKFKVLDAYIRVTPLKDLSLTIGQMKIPFSTDNLRSPSQIYFANRSFIAKQISKNLRDVGAMLTYKNNTLIPVELSAGVFNGNGLVEQTWQNDMNFATRLTIEPVKNMGLSAQYYEGKMLANEKTDRIKMYDFGINYRIGNFFIDSEYAHKTSKDTASQQITHSNAFFIFGAYDFWLTKGFITYITPAFRYDFMDQDVNLGLIEPQRYTAGLTFGLNKKYNTTHVRINYEKYMYHDLPNLDDKLVVEFMVKF